MERPRSKGGWPTSPRGRPGPSPGYSISRDRRTGSSDRLAYRRHRSVSFGLRGSHITGQSRRVPVEACPTGTIDRSPQALGGPLFRDSPAWSGRRNASFREKTSAFRGSRGQPQLGPRRISREARLPGRQDHPPNIQARPIVFLAWPGPRASQAPNSEHRVAPEPTKPHSRGTNLGFSPTSWEARLIEYFGPRPGSTLGPLLPSQSPPRVEAGPAPPYKNP